MKKIIILGGGDLARKTIELIKKEKNYKIVGYYNVNQSLIDYKYLGTFSNFYTEKYSLKKISFVLAFGGAPEFLLLRKKIISTLIKKKLNTPNILSKFAKINSNVKIGYGIVAFDNSYVDFGCQIGNFVVLNVGCTILHDSIIGDNIIISPKSLILGRCKLKEDIFVGAGAVLNPKIIVEKNVIIGSMSNVLKDIKQKGIYLGNPARKLTNK